MIRLRFLPGLAAAAALVSSCNSPPEAEPGGAGGTGSGGTSAGASSGGKSGAGGSGVSTGGSTTGSGGTGTAGAAGTGTAGTGTAGTGTVVTESFQLLWEDQFDGFDGGRWEKRDHTFPENAAVFNPDNVVVEGGLLKLKVTNVPRGDKAYSAAEIRTFDTFLYGRFEARIKFHQGRGIVSSLFTYRYEPWNEIDIEYLGNQPAATQYNLITRPPGGGDLTYQPFFNEHDYAPFAEFHDYALEWTPSEVRFYVDGAQTHVETQNVNRLSNEVNLHMNCWPTVFNPSNPFAGTLDTGAIPTEAQYDWVKVYSYVP